MSQYREIRKMRIERRATPEARRRALSFNLLMRKPIVDYALSVAGATELQEKEVIGRLREWAAESEIPAPHAMLPGIAQQEGCRFDFGGELDGQMAAYLSLRPIAPSPDQLKERAESASMLGSLLLLPEPDKDQLCAMEKELSAIEPSYFVSPPEGTAYFRTQFAQRILTNRRVMDGLISQLDPLDWEGVCETLVRWMNLQDLLFGAGLEQTLKLAQEVSEMFPASAFDLHMFSFDAESPDTRSAAYAGLAGLECKLIHELGELLLAKEKTYMELECTYQDLHKVLDEIRLRTAPDGSIRSPEEAQRRRFAELMGMLRRELADMPGVLSMIDEIEDAGTLDQPGAAQPNGRKKDDKAN